MPPSKPTNSVFGLVICRNQAFPLIERYRDFANNRSPAKGPVANVAAQ